MFLKCHLLRSLFVVCIFCWGLFTTSKCYALEYAEIANYGLVIHEGFKSEQKKVSYFDSKDFSEITRDYDSRSHISNDAYELITLLDRAIKQHRPYPRVVMYSGGGSVQTGYEVGRVLRAYSDGYGYVAVVKSLDENGKPVDAYCISACTFAFLGGKYRNLEKGARYEVHSMSAIQAYQNKENKPQYRDTHEDWVKLIQQPNKTLLYLIESKFDEPQGLYELIQYLTEMYNDHYDRNVAIGIQQSVVSSFTNYFTSYKQNKLSSDIEKIKQYGESGAEKVFFELENEPIKMAIHDLKKQQFSSSVGLELAIKWIDRMYSSSFKNTYTLTDEDLDNLFIKNIVGQ